MINHDDVLSMRRRGLSYQAIANRLGATRNQVAGIIYRSGETRDAAKAGKRANPEFRKMVSDDSGTLYEVAVRWGVSTSSVHAWRKGYGVCR